MTDAEEIVRQILVAAGGEIVGRIRFQKIAYLLEQRGMHSGLDFSYHHYGPYSEDLSNGITWANVLDKTIEEHTKPSSFGGFYSVYRLVKADDGSTKTVGSIPINEAEQFIADMKAESSVVLELAATIHWLRSKEKIENWESELSVRKASKATKDRIAKAQTLLSKLSLAA